MKNKFPKKAWFDPRIEVRKSKISGNGSFAKIPIKKGEKIIQWGGGVLVSKKDFEKGLKEGKYKPETAVNFTEDIKWVETANSPDTPDAYLNHSCNPNLWFIENWALATKKNIKTGEELTFDYSTGENYPLKYKCKCGSKNCRKNITGKEWRNKLFRKKYSVHFSPYIQELINKNKLEL